MKCASLKLICQFLLPFQSLAWNVHNVHNVQGCCGAYPRNTHSAALCNAIVCTLEFGCIETKCEKLRYWAFWTSTHSTQPGRGNLFDILRNQAFSLRQRTFSGKILRTARRKSSVGQFWFQFGQEGIHPEWTRWPKCVSQPQLGSVVVPFGSRY